MENKGGKDAFAGSALGCSDKYLKRHQQAIRLERAAEFDKQVIDFDSQNHTLDWANVAISFCERMTKVGAEFADVSNGMKELPRIRRDAETIIAADNRKHKEEQDKINRQIQENNLRIQMNEDKMVANIEQMILNISASNRDRAWLSEVEKTTLYLKGVESRLAERVSNRFLLEAFVNEAKDVCVALDLDDEIVELAAIRARNKAWAERVFKAEKSLSNKHDRYMREKNTLFELIGPATQIYYGEDFTAINFFIEKVEAGELESVSDNYANINKIVGKLHDIIYLDDFIDDFETRWEAAKNAATSYIRANKKAETAKAKAEKAEQQRRRDELEARRIKEDSSRKDKIMLFAAVRSLLLIAVIAAVAVYGVVKFNVGGGGWILGIGATLIVLYLRYVRFGYLFSNVSEYRITGNIVIASLACAYNIASVFFPVLGLYGLPLLLAVFAIVILDLISGSGVCEVNILNLATVTLGLTLFGAIGGIGGAILAGIIFIAAGVVHHIVCRITEPYDEEYAFASALAMMVVSLVVVWFAGAEFIIMAICLAIASLLIGVRCYMCEETKFIGLSDLIYLILIIISIIVSIII